MTPAADEWPDVGASTSAEPAVAPTAKRKPAAKKAAAKPAAIAKTKAPKTASDKPKAAGPAVTKTVKTAAAKAAKPTATKAAGTKPNALQQPLKPSAELGAIVGASPLPRGEVVSKVWDYIKKHNLQNPENKREIMADDKLKKVFGKDKATMFEMNKYLAQHLK